MIDTLNPRPWMSEALCHQTIHPDEWFTNHPSKGNHATEQAAALTICAGCPVRDECLEYALDNREEWGIWGGKTKQDRQAILRERGDGILHGTPKGYYAHKRAGQEPCDSCRKAHNRYARDRYQANKTKKRDAA